MATPSSGDVTQLLLDWSRGNREALDKVIPLVYDELHRMAEFYMRRERPGHTLKPTALVHEAYVRLIDQTRVQWRNRAHFFGIAAGMMRRILVDYARYRRAVKRVNTEISLERSALGSVGRDVDVIALDDALKSLAVLDPQQSRIVEVRFFGGLTIEETAEALRMSPSTVKREWSTAKIWLLHEMGGGAP